jgi:hypothetical protein
MNETSPLPTEYLDPVETRCKRCGAEADPGWLVPATRKLSDLGRPVVKYCLACWSRKARKLTAPKPLMGEHGLRVFAIASIVMTVCVIILPVLNIAFSFVLVPIMFKIFSQCNSYPEDPSACDHQRVQYERNLAGFRDVKTTGSIMEPVECARHHDARAIARCDRCGEALCVWCLMYESLDGYKELNDLARTQMLVRSMRSGSAARTSGGSFGNAIAGAIVTGNLLLQLPPAAMITSNQRAMYGDVKEMLPSDLRYMYTTGVHQLVLRVLAGHDNLLRSFNSITFQCPSHKDTPAKLARRKAYGHYLPRMVAIAYLPFTLTSLIIMLFFAGPVALVYALLMPCITGGLVGCMSTNYRNQPFLDDLFGANPLKKANPGRFNDDIYRLMDVLANELVPRLRNTVSSGKIVLCPRCGQLQDAGEACETCRTLAKT